MYGFSIICACYNSEKYITDSIRSILNQTFQDFELIIIDDASTDKTLDIIKQLIDIHSARIKVISNTQNVGVFRSRTYGFMNATGKYIAIHDSDDVSVSTRLEKQYAFMERNSQIDFCGSFATRIGEFGDVIGSMVYPPMDTLGAFRVIQRFKLNPIIDPSSVCKREVLMKSGGYRLDNELRYAADFDLWCRLLSNGYLMANIPEMLIQYRIHSLSNSKAKHVEMRQATEIIWGNFCKRNFPEMAPLICRTTN